MTQAELARASHIPRPNLSTIERGDRDVTLRTLRALALALDVTPGTLADGVSPHQSSSPLRREAMERIAAAAVTGRPLANPREARGIGGALHALARQPAGRWLFGAVAVGLAAYGLFVLLLARYRRMVIR